MTATLVRTDRDGVAELRLDRPESRNALTTALLAELRDELRAIAQDPATRAVILTGAGDAFCAGADLRELPADGPADDRLRRIRLVTEAIGLLLQLEQPSVAAVQGAAVGAGWGLALACDLCFVTTDVRLSLPEVSKGLRVPQLLMRRLVQVVGPQRAAELAYAGTVYGADEALAAGCAARVLNDRDEAVAAAWELGAALASSPRSSVLTAKQPLRALAPQLPFPPQELTWTEE
jgi:enoyl-CoA hydratase/carnithine racemase